MFTMLSGLAELEREQLLERQRIGINRAKAEGRYKGRAKVDSTLLESIDTLVNSGTSIKKA